MSDASKPILDLSDLRLAPKWVSDFSKPSRSESDHSFKESSERRPFRDRDSRGGNTFRGRDQRSGGGTGARGPQGDRPSFQRDRNSNRRPDSRDRNDGGRRHEGQGRFRDRNESRQEHVRLINHLTVTVAPELKATEAVAAMIKSAGKAYSVFEAAKLILASGDRFVVKYQFAEEETAKLFAIPSTSSLWLSKDEALQQLLQSESLAEFYRKEEVTLEAPKGNFASVAVCGFSGQPLGPASHHSFQTTVARVHRERFAHMSLEDYKKRLRTDSSPEAIEKWKDSVSKGFTFTYLKGEEGAEPVVLNSQAEMEAHFRANHAEALIKEVKEAAVAGNIPKQLLSPALYLHLRKAVDEARKHLLQIAQQLCSIFEQSGLKLFKRRGGKLWVSKTRPRAIDPAVTLSERIGKLVEVIKGNPGIKSQDLIELVAPSAAPAVEAPVAEEAVVAEAPVIESPVTEEAAPEEASAEASAIESAPTEEVSKEEAPVAEVAAATETKELTEEQIQAIKDLHWLNSEGFVIEYADGVVFPGVTEPPPPKPKAPKVKAEKSEVVAEAPAPSEWDEAPAEAAAEEVSSEVVAEEAVVTEETAPEAASEVVAEEAAAPEAPAEEASSEEAPTA